MSYYDKHFELIMRFVDYIITASRYRVAELNKSNQRSVLNLCEGYRAENFPLDQYQSIMLSVNYSMMQVSRADITTHVERWALANSDDDFSAKGTAIQNILQVFANDFVEHFFVFEESNFSNGILIQEGYRSQEKNGNMRIPSKLSAHFSAIQPSKDEFKREILFFLSNYLK